MQRLAVFAVLAAERAYQLKRWGKEVSTFGVTELVEAPHSIEEYMLYMEDYLHEARHQVSRLPEPEARKVTLDTLRKVITLGIACFEQHGVPSRNHGPVTNGRTGKVYE